MMSKKKTILKMMILLMREAITHYLILSIARDINPKILGTNKEMIRNYFNEQKVENIINLLNYKNKLRNLNLQERVSNTRL